MSVTIESEQPQETSKSVGLDSGHMLSATLLVMVFFVLSRMTGLAREIILSDRFGTSAAYDAYLAAFRVPDLLFQLVAGGALGSAFLPVFTSFWIKDDKPGAWLLFSRVLNLIVMVLVGLAAFAAVFSEPIVRYGLAPGFSPEQALVTAQLMRMMLVGTVIFGISGLVMGALNATQHFIAPAAAPVLYNLAIIMAAYWLGPTMGVYGLALGVVAGSMAHLLVQIPALLRRGARYSPSFSLADPAVRQVAKLMGPRVLGLLFVQMHFVVNTVLASALSPGSLSALNYALLLMLLSQGIIAQAIATVAFPTFSAQAAAGQLDLLRTTFERTLRMVLFLVAPAALGLLVLRRPTISILFEHGAFNTESMILVAYGLQFYLLGLIAHSLLEIVVRGFYALQNTWIPVTVGVAAMSANIGLSFLFVGSLSFGGLALANSVATSVETALLLWLLSRRMGGLHWPSLMTSAARTLAAALIMAAIVWAWGRWIYVNVYLGGAVAMNDDWLTFAGGALLALLLYAGVSWLLRSAELQLLVAAARARWPRR